MGCEWGGVGVSGAVREAGVGSRLYLPRAELSKATTHHLPHNLLVHHGRLHQPVARNPDLLELLELGEVLPHEGFVVCHAETMWARGAREGADKVGSTTLSGLGLGLGRGLIRADLLRRGGSWF